MGLIQTIEACCPTVLDPGVDAQESGRLAEAFRVLADPSRIRLLNLIARAGECCVCELTAPVGLSQPTVSHHLKILADAGFLTREKRGTWVYYRVDPAAFATMRRLFDLPRVDAGATASL